MMSEKRLSKLHRFLYLTAPDLIQTAPMVEAPASATDPGDKQLIAASRDFYQGLTRFFGVKPDIFDELLTITRELFEANLYERGRFFYG